MNLHDSYPAGQGVITSRDMTVLDSESRRAIENPLFVQLGEYLTAFELQIAILMVRCLLLNRGGHDFSPKNMRRVFEHLCEDRTRRHRDWGVHAPTLFV